MSRDVSQLGMAETLTDLIAALWVKGFRR